MLQVIFMRIILHKFGSLDFWTLGTTSLILPEFSYAENVSGKPPQEGKAMTTIQFSYVLVSPSWFPSAAE